MSRPTNLMKRGQDKSRKARRGWEWRFACVFRGLRQGAFSARALRRNRRLGKHIGIRAFPAVR